jgi:hypothetical protein
MCLEFNRAIQKSSYLNLDFFRVGLKNLKEIRVKVQTLHLFEVGRLAHFDSFRAVKTGYPTLKGSTRMGWVCLNNDGASRGDNRVGCGRLIRSGKVLGYIIFLRI